MQTSSKDYAGRSSPVVLVSCYPPDLHSTVYCCRCPACKAFQGQNAWRCFYVAMLELLLICHLTTTTTSDTRYIVRHTPPVPAITVPAIALRFPDGSHFTDIKLRPSLIRTLHQNPRRKHAYYTQGLRVCLPSSGRGSFATVPAIWTS